jgi:hypothetical protein
MSDDDRYLRRGAVRRFSDILKIRGVAAGTHNLRCLSTMMSKDCTSDLSLPADDLAAKGKVP